MHFIHLKHLSAVPRFLFIPALIAVAIAASASTGQGQANVFGHSGLRMQGLSSANSSYTVARPTSQKFPASLHSAISPIAPFSPISLSNPTWLANFEALPVLPAALRTTPAHSSIMKRIPVNALTPTYTQAMLDSDMQLANIFGGPGTIAAANGFEPEGLASNYPLYRGDLLGADQQLLRGHLSEAMHVYGSVDGTGESELYVPAGFTSHSHTPTPTDAAVTFFYPRLGNFTNVTLAVFHVANFELTEKDGRVRIGNIGGRGGSIACYRHSHIEFYRGDTGLPAVAVRSTLRINPTSVFGSNSDLASRSTMASTSHHASQSTRAHH